MSEIKGDEIERFRGDTGPDTLTLFNPDGTPKDLTGYGYKLTINRKQRPPDDSEQLMTTNGTIANPLLGVISFPWSYAQGNQVPGKYWYDVQQTDPAGKVLTILKNRYTFMQDITKNTA